MITAGIDAGAKNTKTVILQDNEIVAKHSALSGFDQKASAEEAFNGALEKADLKKEDINFILATGSGMKEITFANDTITEVGAAARGATHLFPNARTVIDVGAEEGRALKCDENGKVVDFAINEKCAAGAGAFTESMARALEVKLEDIGELSLRSDQEIEMNAQCAVFAESEVVSLIHAKTTKENIARAVHDAISSRITAMVRKVGIEKEIALIGGVARNVGFVDSIKRDLESEVLIPEDPEFIGALGAAIAATEKAGKGSGGD
jgi:benzoyl-CoA reductase subunit D